jgi:UDP-2,3-diacylglucosamine hydrolase
VDLWLLSDIHLKSNEERNSKILLRFLLSLKNNERPITHLILLGDIFDLWIGGHEVFVERWKAHLDIIKYLIQQKKVEVIFVEGNHDVHIAPYWERQMGAHVFTEPTSIFVKPFKLHLEHGDLINQSDKKYLKYRALIRSAPLKFMGLNLPGIFWDRLGAYMSKKSGEHSREFRAEQLEQMKQLIRNHARALSQKVDPADFIFTGHFHLKDEFEILINEKKIRSINLGSWLGENVEVYHLNEQKGHFVSLV